MKQTERQHYSAETMYRVSGAARYEGVPESTIVYRAIGYRTASIYRWIKDHRTSRIRSSTLAQINQWLDEHGYDEHGKPTMEYVQRKMRIE